MNLAAKRSKSTPKKRVHTTPSAPAAPTKYQLTKNHTAITDARTAKTPTKPQPSKISEPSEPSEPLKSTSTYEICITIPGITIRDRNSLERNLINLVDHYAFAILHQHEALAKAVLDRIIQCEHIDLNAFMIMVECFYEHAADNPAIVVSEMCLVIEKAFGGFLFSIVAATLLHEIIKKNGPIRDLLYQQISAYYKVDLSGTPRDLQDAVFRPFIGSLEQEVQKWLDEAKPYGQES